MRKISNRGGHCVVIELVRREMHDNGKQYTRLLFIAIPLVVLQEVKTDYFWRVVAFFNTKLPIINFLPTTSGYVAVSAFVPNNDDRRLGHNMVAAVVIASRLYFLSFILLKLPQMMRKVALHYHGVLARYKAVGYLCNETDTCTVHRDIKPSDIFLSSRKLAKLCDFGLATWTPSPSVPFLCKSVKGAFGYVYQ